MAEPAPKREDPIYDQPGNAPSRPQLKALEGGGQTSPPTGNLRSASPNNEDLKQKEQNLGSADGAAGHENQVGKGYTPTNNFPVGFRANPRKWLIKNRRKAIGGGGIIGTLIGIVLFLTISSGPLQFIHLSQILQRNFSNNENTSSIRLKGLYRYAKSGQIGETRVGAVGSRVFGTTVDRLKAAGIEFQTNKQGYIRTATLDPVKLESKFPELKGMTEAEQRSFLANEFGVDESLISRSGGTFNVDARSLGVKATRALVKNGLSVLDDGKIVSAIRLRAVTKYFGLPSLFHPLEKVKAAINNKFSGKAAIDAETKAQENRINTELEAPTNTNDFRTARDRVKGAISSKTLSRLLIIQAGVCALHDAAGAAIVYNRASIVIPATLDAADKISLGEQIKSGNDFDLSQYGPVANNFIDSNGKSIWDAQALQATAGVATTGQDLPTEYGQAFNSNTTADKIKDETNPQVTVAGVTISACSAVAQYLSAIIGVAALIAAVPTDGGTAVALFASEAAAKAGTAAALFYFGEKFATNLAESKAIVTAQTLNGVLGGNLLAYGARELANIDARGSGGVALDNSNTSVTSAAQDAQYQQEFNSKSLFAKIFDAKDYRSVTGKLIDSSSPSFSKNFAKMGTNLFHFGNIFSGLTSIFSGKAAAASPAYDWGSPRYGIPDSIANNPSYEDPYANADYVAKNILDNTDISSDYTDRAHTCFGVTINRDSENHWQVVPAEDVNPGSSDYTDKSCSDTSDTNWQRLMLFIFDSRTMDAAACYDGGADADTSCANSGIGSATSSTNEPTPAGTYVNPFRDVQKGSSFASLRIDEGVDYAGTGPVYAVGNGIVTEVASGSSGFWGNYGGNSVVYKLTDPGPANGKSIFVAEGCTPESGLAKGSVVTSSTKLCEMYQSHYGIETGWAMDDGTDTPKAYPDYTIAGHPDGSETAYGLNFSQFMKSINAPAGNEKLSTNPGVIVGSLQAGWPSW